MEYSIDRLLLPLLQKVSKMPRTKDYSSNFLTEAPREVMFFKRRAQEDISLVSSFIGTPMYYDYPHTFTLPNFDDEKSLHDSRIALRSTFKAISAGIIDSVGLPVSSYKSESSLLSEYPPELDGVIETILSASKISKKDIDVYFILAENKYVLLSSNINGRIFSNSNRDYSVAEIILSCETLAGVKLSIRILLFSAFANRANIRSILEPEKYKPKTVPGTNNIKITKRESLLSSRVFISVFNSFVPNINSEFFLQATVIAPRLNSKLARESKGVFATGLCFYEKETVVFSSVQRLNTWDLSSLPASYSTNERKIALCKAFNVHNGPLNLGCTSSPFEDVKTYSPIYWRRNALIPKYMLIVYNTNSILLNLTVLRRSPQEQIRSPMWNSSYIKSKFERTVIVDSVNNSEVDSWVKEGRLVDRPDYTVTSRGYLPNA